MTFEALGELLDESLPLPIRGTVYRVPAPSAETGLRVQAIMQAAAVSADGGRVDEALLADAAERDMYADVLGAAHAEMIAGGVTWPELKHAGITAMVWIIQDKDKAAAYWNSGGDPKRLAPNRAARRKGSSGGAKSTRSQDSTSTTSPRPAPRRDGARSGKRRPSSGAKSSTSGL